VAADIDAFAFPTRCAGAGEAACRRVCGRGRWGGEPRRVVGQLSEVFYLPSPNYSPAGDFCGGRDGI